MPDFTWSKRRRGRVSAGRRRAPWAAAGLSAVLLTVSSGCSGAADAPAAPDCASAPGITGDTVRLGLLMSDSGTAASQVIGARSGIDARIESENDRGGVHGRRIVYDWRDDGSNPAANLIAAQDLVERGGIFGLLSASVVATGSADYLHEREIPIAGLATEPAWSSYDNMVSYLNRVPTAVVYDTLAQFARSKGVQRAVIVKTSMSAASEVGAQRIERILRHAGIEIVAAVDYTPNGITAATLGRQIAQTGADGLFGALAGDQFAEVYNGAVAAGAPLRAGVGTNGYGHELLSRYGAKIAGAYFYLAYQPFEADTPAQREYQAALARHAPELHPPDAQAAVESYIVTDLLIRGLDAAGPCPTRAGLLAALRSITDFDGAGLLPGPVDLTKGFGQSASCLTFVQVNQAGTGFDVEQPRCGQPISGPAA
ncbi:ABC transporter substrate-binding protein [Parafrankia colletiae]|uniref:ABC transporter substrate-binding protein n=1 Tax=Parafrankia colletiae TaxID=573497 RepID=UPI003898D655